MRQLEAFDRISRIFSVKANSEPEGRLRLHSRQGFHMAVAAMVIFALFEGAFRSPRLAATFFEPSMPSVVGHRGLLVLCHFISTICGHTHVVPKPTSKTTTTGSTGLCYSFWRDLLLKPSGQRVRARRPRTRCSVEAPCSTGTDEG